MNVSKGVSQPTVDEFRWPAAWWTASLPRRRRRCPKRRVQFPDEWFQFAPLGTGGHGRRSTADEQARYALAVARLGVEFQPDRAGWQTVSCPFDDHHPNGDRHPSARLNLDECRLYCNVAARSWLYRDLVERSPAPPGTSNRTPSPALRRLVERLVALRPQILADLLPDAAVTASYGPNTRKITAAHRVRHLLQALLAEADDHMLRVRLTANAVKRHTGLNARFYRPTLELAEHLGLEVEFGQSGRNLAKVGRALADQGHVRATRVSVNEHHLTRVVLTGERGGPRVNTPVDKTDGPPSTFHPEYLPTGPVVAHRAGYGPLDRRPALARTLALLRAMPLGLATVNALADLDGCTERTMKRRLRCLVGLDFVRWCEPGVIAKVTRRGVLVFDDANDGAKIKLAERADSEQQAWRAAQQVAAEARRNRPGDDDGTAPPHTDADYHGDEPEAVADVGLEKALPAASGDWERCVGGDCDDGVEEVAER